MTITRIWQASAELDNILLEFSSRSATSAQTSTAEAKSGSRSFLMNASNVTASKVLSSSLTQAAFGFFFNHLGVSSGDNPAVFTLYNTSTQCIQLRFDGTTLTLLAGATTLGTVLSSEFANTDTWIHVGLDVKIDGSVGWAYLYIDGTAVIEFDGDTNNGAASFNTVMIGSPISLQTWNTPFYYDDLYLDDTSGESAPVPVPDYRFLLVSPDGNGYSSDWVGSDGNSTDNYLLVDELPPDDDTSYVESAAGGETDAYTMSDPTIPEGWETSAVIPLAVVKKLNAGGALNLKLITRTTVSGSPYSASSAAITLATSYALAWERRALAPDGGGWDEDRLNALEIGVRPD